MNLNTNKVSPEGGLEEKHAAAMNMKANLLAPMDLTEKFEKIWLASANTGGDKLTSNHMLNWMQSVRDLQGSACAC